MNLFFCKSSKRRRFERNEKKFYWKCQLKKLQSYLVEPRSIKVDIRILGQEDPLLIKDQDRKQHGEYLKSRYFDSIYKANSEILQENISRQGIYLEFRSEENFELPINSLENRRSKNQQNNIRLLNIRKEGKSTFATIYIPQKKIGYFQKKLDQYLEENTRKKEPKNKKLINNIKIQSGLKLKHFYQNDEKVEDEPFGVKYGLVINKRSKRCFNNVLK